MSATSCRTEPDRTGQQRRAGPTVDEGRPGRSGLDVDAAASGTNDHSVSVGYDDSALIGVVRDEFGCPVGLAVHDDLPLGRPLAADGARRRDVGHRHVAQAAGGEGWLGLAEAWIVAAGARGVQFTGETLRAAVGEPPSANLLGVAMQRARRRGLIVPVGTTTAQRPEAHRRLLRVWAARRAEP